MDFSGRTVVVTGAGKGIGRATACYLAARGAAVVALSRSAEDLAGLAAAIGCRTVAVDLADADATRAAARAAQNRAAPATLISSARRASHPLGASAALAALPAR